MIFCNGFLQRSSPNHKILNALKNHLWKHLWQKLRYIHQIPTLKMVKITYAKNLNKKITCDGGKNCWQYFSSCFFFFQWNHDFIPAKYTRIMLYLSTENVTECKIFSKNVNLINIFFSVFCCMYQPMYLRTYLPVYLSH